MKLGDQLTKPNVNFDEIFCNCYASLASLEDFNFELMETCAAEIEWIVPSPRSYCESYFGKAFNTDGYIEMATDTTSNDGEETLWKTLVVIFSILLAGIISFNIW